MRADEVVKFAWKQGIDPQRKLRLQVVVIVLKVSQKGSCGLLVWTILESKEHKIKGVKKLERKGMPVYSISLGFC